MSGNLRLKETPLSSWALIETIILTIQITAERTTNFQYVLRHIEINSPGQGIDGFKRRSDRSRRYMTWL